MNNMPKTYEDVADECELEPNTKDVYVKYMRIRWGGSDAEQINCSCGYALEWAIRFKRGYAYQSSDLEGQAILRSLKFGDSQCDTM